MRADAFEQLKKFLTPGSKLVSKDKFPRLSDNAAKALINELKRFDDFKARSMSNGAKKVMR